MIDIIANILSIIADLTLAIACCVFISKIQSEKPVKTKWRFIKKIDYYSLWYIKNEKNETMYQMTKGEKPMCSGGYLDLKELISRYTTEAEAKDE